MVNSSVNAIVRSAVACSATATALLLGVRLAGAAQNPPPQQQQQPVQLNAVSGEFDYRNNTALLHDVSLKQGDIEIKALEAVATGNVNDMTNSQLTFRKQVKITTTDGWLLSETAEVTFRDRRMVRAVIVGTPATFERRAPDTQDIARGRAGTIVYDVAAETVQLQNDAYFTYGGKDINAQNVVYNLRSDTVFANGGERKDKPVRITIDPASDPHSVKKPTPP